MHPHSELTHPARNEGKMSPEESTGLLPHSAYNQKQLQMALWGLLAKPQHASFTLTMASLWFLKVDVVKKSWITPYPVRYPGGEGGKADDLGLKVRWGFLIEFKNPLKDIPQRNSPGRILDTLFTIYFLLCSILMLFLIPFFSSWNTLLFLPILCISADRHLINLKAQLRCGILQVCSGVPLHFCVPCKAHGAGWSDDGSRMLIS